MPKQKYYVVWKGAKPGIYISWDDCKKQVSGYAGAEYKSYESRAEAETAYKKGSGTVYKEAQHKKVKEVQQKISAKPIIPSISVDGAWNTMSGVCEYRGVDTSTGKEIFYSGTFDDGTNNIVEFLAIVHALAYCKHKNSDLPVYSDSRTAIVWVKNKNAKTNHPRNSFNKKLFEKLDGALKWLHENSYSTKVLKWETEEWGENPADFGRK